MIANTSKRLGRNNKNFLSKKGIIVILIPVFLVATLIFTNVTVSVKTYQLINCNKELDNLAKQLKDLLEEKEAITSPMAIRERAVKDLDMVDIENIDELIIIHP